MTLGDVTSTALAEGDSPYNPILSVKRGECMLMHVQFGVGRVSVQDDDPDAHFVVGKASFLVQLPFPSRQSPSPIAKVVTSILNCAFCNQTVLLQEEVRREEAKIASKRRRKVEEEEMNGYSVNENCVQIKEKE